MGSKEGRLAGCGERLVDAGLGDVEVSGVFLNADEPAPRLYAGNPRRAAAHAVVKDSLTFFRVGLYQVSKQISRLLRRVNFLLPVHSFVFKHIRRMMSVIGFVYLSHVIAMQERTSVESSAVSRRLLPLSKLREIP